MKRILQRFWAGFGESFTDDKGSVSMTRVCTFILVVGGVVFAYIYPDYEAGYLGLVTLGLGGKITQKRLSETPKENKTASPDPVEP